MATRTLAAVFMFFASTLFCAPVWAQSQQDTMSQMAASMATMAQAMQRLAQSTPAPAAQPAAPTSGTLEDRVQRLEGRVTDVEAYASSRYSELAMRVANHETRLRKVEPLVGRIAPRHDTPAAPKASTGPAAQASAAGSGPGYVRVAELPKEQFRSVAFDGDIPRAGDIAGIERLLGAYDLAQDPVVLPAPGKDDAERAIRAAARNAALQAAWGSPLATRLPASELERDQLVAGAPAGTGVVFHLRLKGAKVAATPAGTPHALGGAAPATP